MGARRLSTEYVAENGAVAARYAYGACSQAATKITKENETDKGLDEQRTEAHWKTLGSLVRGTRGERMVMTLMKSMIAGGCLFLTGCGTLPYDAEGIPGWYWRVLSSDEARWRVCGDAQSVRVAETIRDTVYKPEGLWKDGIENAEKNGCLSAEVYESPDMYSVLWSYPSEAYPRRELHFEFVCVSKTDMKVVMGGMHSENVDNPAFSQYLEDGMPESEGGFH